MIRCILLAVFLPAEKKPARGERAKFGHRAETGGLFLLVNFISYENRRDRRQLSDLTTRLRSSQGSAATVQMHAPTAVCVCVISGLGVSDPSHE